MIHDNRTCELGEGPLWHPLRNQLFWFDIVGNRLLTTGEDGPQEWHFSENVSAAGWIDRDRLLIASETTLFRFNLETGARHDVCLLEASNPVTRSNDGRADPFGGFWIGTMGKSAEAKAGAIYRWYRSELRCLFPEQTIPNSICFDPKGRFAHFTGGDGRVMKVALDAQGWPAAAPEVFLDLNGTTSEPDGAVIAADGTMWLAEWGASRVAAYAPDGTFLRAVAFDAPHTSCPAFGGPEMTTLYCTTARQGMDAAARAAHPNAGMTFAVTGVAPGLPEHQVIL
ncbi:MAG: SMP-30/gluconolactonase/LRE family protein [Paracoccaceae bacterium]